MNHVLSRLMLGLGAVGLMVAMVMGGYAMAAEPGPEYAVLEKAGMIEIRQYQAAAAAQVTVSGDRDDGANAAFRILFQYISGANQGETEIAMTAPVTQVPDQPEAAPNGTEIAMTAPVSQVATGDGNWRVAFYLPREYTAATAPVPTDDRVSIITVFGERKIAIRFSGLWSDENYTKHHDRLRAYIAAQGLETVGEPVFAYYDAPFVPWFLRRNEVLYQLKQDG